MDTEVVGVGEPGGIQEREDGGGRSSLSHVPLSRGRTRNKQSPNPETSEVSFESTSGCRVWLSRPPEAPL